MIINGLARIVLILGLFTLTGRQLRRGRVWTGCSVVLS
jgi:hypothetical protein